VRALRRLLSLLVALPAALVTSYLGFCFLLIALYAVVPPPTTGVQIQRRVEALASGSDYDKRYDPVSRGEISNHLAHAVVAAEDGRFYEHGGIDWDAVRQAMKDNRRRGRTWRGGSGITQQLVKNLFQTTHSSYARKAFEVPLTYAAEWTLSKERILTLYLNVIEWGPGVYGAEAAAQHHFGTSANALSRRQAAGLAAVVPAPRTRTPGRMGWYTSIIETRMRQMGW
jgi:monofunctional biosynthetic peptidoglycan transglycosylase